MVFMNPACINESGDEIPVEHIGFGMLALKEQLSGMDPNSLDGNALKLVPASIERIMVWPGHTHTRLTRDCDFACCMYDYNVPHA